MGKLLMVAQLCQSQQSFSQAHLCLFPHPLNSYLFAAGGRLMDYSKLPDDVTAKLLAVAQLGFLDIALPDARAMARKLLPLAMPPAAARAGMALTGLALRNDSSSSSRVYGAGSMHWAEDEATDKNLGAAVSQCVLLRYPVACYSCGHLHFYRPFPPSTLNSLTASPWTAY